LPVQDVLDGEGGGFVIAEKSVDGGNCHTVMAVDKSGSMSGSRIAKVLVAHSCDPARRTSTLLLPSHAPTAFTPL
jgi:hypothetical protein